MRPLGDPKRHFWLAQRMARLHGLDLVQANARGDLDQDGWAGAVARCRECSWTEGCERFLDRAEASETLPRGCENRGLYSLLLVDQLMGEDS